MPRNTTLNTNRTDSSGAIPFDVSPISDLFKEEKAIQKAHAISKYAINPIETYPDDKIKQDVTKITESRASNISEVQNAALSAGIVKEADPFEMLQQIKEQHANELDKAKLRGDKTRINYLAQMSILIGQLTNLLNEWSKQDNARIHEKKTRYHNSSTEIQDNHKSQGMWKMVFGFVSVGISLTAPGLEGAFNHFSQSFLSFKEADNVKPTQDNSLTITELQKLESAGTNNKQILDQAQQLYQLIQQYVRAANHS